MRLWHKDLIPYLPRQQLISQWRECCAIAANIAKKGFPNHILVNKMMKYNVQFFINYSYIVIEEIKKRGFKINKKSHENFIKNIKQIIPRWPTPYQDFGKELYYGWHNERYLKQCIYNLQEKYDCGGISDEEWKVIAIHFYKYL